MIARDFFFIRSKAKQNSNNEKRQHNEETKGVNATMEWVEGEKEVLERIT